MTDKNILSMNKFTQQKVNNRDNELLINL